MGAWAALGREVLAEPSRGERALLGRSKGWLWAIEEGEQGRFWRRMPLNGRRAQKRRARMP